MTGLNIIHGSTTIKIVVTSRPTEAESFGRAGLPHFISCF